MDGPSFNDIPPIDMDTVLARYTVLLLDAYGVLVHSRGAMGGAAAFIDRLNRDGIGYFILTNDASKLPETAAALFQSYGLAVDADRIITSGSLIGDYFSRNKLAGARCAVLGPADSCRYVRQAGGRIVSCQDDFDVLVIGDESGFPFMETVDAVLSTLIGKIDGRQPVHLLVPNPDVIYPKGNGRFGFASGAVAHMFEAAIQGRYPACPDLRFHRLGKPHRAIFNAALRRAGTRNMVMIGDQPKTDIRGANRFGIDGVLFTGSATAPDLQIPDAMHRPAYRMTSLI